ncbi:Carotenoid 9-10(9'-10')-cleavage dioxygenase 1 [Nymphaea thermarum]|nr:Carotenoid 9-10(9'-10')-cleavage dioxygenase 1 [Nymphaea thermarum]
MGKQEEKKKESGDGVVVVEPKLKAGFLSCLLDAVEDLVVRIATSKSKQQRQFFLTGNHAPVPETPPVHNLPVRGFLPVSLMEMGE